MNNRDEKFKEDMIKINKNLANKINNYSTKLNST